MRLVRLFRTRPYSAATAAAALVCAVSCTSSGAPSILPADVEATGNLTVTNCQTPVGGAFIEICNFSGLMTNNGPGCASGISGTTTSTANGSSTVVGTANWTVAGITLAVGQTATYTGSSLTVPAGSSFSYHTTIAFTSVECPPS